jgi:hypothetical protein
MDVSKTSGMMIAAIAAIVIASKESHEGWLKSVSEWPDDRRVE